LTFFFSNHIFTTLRWFTDRKIEEEGTLISDREISHSQEQFDAARTFWFTEISRQIRGYQDLLDEFTRLETQIVTNVSVFEPGAGGGVLARFVLRVSRGIDRYTGIDPFPFNRSVARLQMADNRLSIVRRPFRE